MIKLTKGAEPMILATHSETWRDQVLIALSTTGKIPEGLSKRYRHEQIKSAVLSECYEKCMYCEAKVTHISYGDIEHIIPKAKHPELIFTWSNLGLACTVCNNNKSDTYLEETPFINPYVDNPDEHFRAVGAYIYHKPGSVRGEITEKGIDINRGPLLEDRLATIEKIRPLLDRYVSSTGPIKSFIKASIIDQLKSDKEYSYCLSHFVKVLLGAPIN